ncbi:MAG TPA: hypothetical protein VNM47_18055 [Terriglobia bacterium]|nr:hypothetical protein [Terriglobia bacterium]
MEFQLEDKLAQGSAVDSESPGQIESGIARTAGAAKHLGSVSGMLRDNRKPAPTAGDSFPTFDSGPAPATYAQTAGTGNFTPANGALRGENNCEQAVSQFLKKGTKM